MRLLVIILLISQSVFAQKYFTRTGSTGFRASVKAFEPVQALNKSTSAIITNDGQIAAQLFISAFKFRLALMQEHFNENFMDSAEFPKATFRGKVEDVNLSELKDSKEVVIKGVLTVKGIDKNIETKGTLSRIGDKVKLVSKLVVLPGDFNIEIPSLIRRKIAREVTIDLNYEFTEKK
ncbi:YceI family protein [Tenacibaculum sp. 190524A05c]|uniref:YceI-like domain-containing protein n=1 Tax=Tenacibaculum platacis TaxID=3137852 RepID=A0ABP1EPR3_9FLAO